MYQFKKKPSQSGNVYYYINQDLQYRVETESQLVLQCMNTETCVYAVVATRKKEGKYV